MRPPVALLIYPAEGEERRGAYYPFADFSPEWNALRYALSSGIEARFMDLPQSHQLAGEEALGPEQRPGNLRSGTLPLFHPGRRRGRVAGFQPSQHAPWAFTHYATCALAPAQNRLSFAARAGEKTP